MLGPVFIVFLVIGLSPPSKDGLCDPGVVDGGSSNPTNSPRGRRIVNGGCKTS